MKKIIVVLLFFVLALSSVVMGASSGLNSYWINVTMINQEPDPAEAGRYVTLRFKLENTGTDIAKDVTVELLIKYPFSLEPGESATKYIGSIRARQMGDTGVIVDYRVRVDEKAIEGENEVELRYKLSNQDWVKPEAFTVDIGVHDILLNIESIDSPRMIRPGAISNIDVKLKNLAQSFVKEIKVTLELTGIPIATIGETNRKIISQMEGLSESTVQFNLMAEPDAESKLYKVPIKLEYRDRIGNLYMKNETVGLIVGDEPDIAASIDTSTVYSSGRTGDVSVKLVNKGVTDIKFMTVKIGDGQYKVLSAKEVYVGNIDSDDYESADFKLSLSRVKGNEVALPLRLEYEDANNNEYTQDVTVEMPLYTASEAKALGLSKGSSGVGLFIVLLIVGAGIYAYIRIKNKKPLIPFRRK